MFDPVQAASVGEKSIIDQARASVDLMQLQVAIANRISAAAAAAQGGRSSGALPLEPFNTNDKTAAMMAGDVKAVRGRCMDIDTLYNTYAQPYGMWDSCLRLCNAANTVPSEYVRQLWDLLLKYFWEAAVGADGHVNSDVRLALCCERTQDLGARFYPNDNRCVAMCFLLPFLWLPLVSG
jgi:nuclear pore complex protein Nup155